MKLRSSSGTSEGPDQSGCIDGLRYDGFGYICPAPHFLNLLKVDGMRKLVEATKEYRQQQICLVPANLRSKEGGSGKKRKLEQAEKVTASGPHALGLEAQPTPPPQSAQNPDNASDGNSSGDE